MGRENPASEVAATSWRAWLTRWIGEPLTGEEAEAFATETSDRDVRRAGALAAVQVVLHLAHLAVYRLSDGERATLAPEIVRWQDHVVGVHAMTLPLAVGIVAVCSRFPQSQLGRRIGPVGAAIYLLHGALATGVDQIAFANVAAFTGYCFGIAVICSFPLRTSAWIYGLATVVVAAALFRFQADAAVRTSLLLNAITVAVTSVALNVLLYNARRRDFRQRRIIARQRDELTGLNQHLERRVEEQVTEIVKRAEEVNQLNAQLRSQIRTRSSELQAALAKLAAQREEADILRTGALLGDRFEVDRRIGVGGMGVVYSGVDRITGTTVAIKVIRPGGAIEIDSMRRFLGEASAVASIVHPAVVRMIHVDISDDGFLYQAQEFVDGVTLEQRLNGQFDGAAWPQPVVARLGAVLCDALAAAHVRGVIHRDIKPANVMLVGDAPGLKLLDFGLAKLFEETPRDDRHRTGSRLVVGTPAYMAPEQVMSGEITDKSDMYSVGVLLFQLLTGRLAFETDGASKVMMKHVSVQAPDVRALRTDVEEQLAELVAACLSKEADDRPTAGELGRKLAVFADTHGAPALETLCARAAGEPPPADSSGRATTGNTASIARRMRGLAGALTISTITLTG